MKSINNNSERSGKMKRIISFVIPCYRSEKTIKPVIDEIDQIISKNNNYDYEVICVNDFSPDNVWEVLKDISSKNKKVKCINLAKNMSRPGALMAGLNYAKGDYTVMMDDDGQCPMDHIWDLIKPLEEGHDVTVAKYTKYKQSIFKSIGTFINKKMSEIVVEVPKEIEFTNFIAVKSYIKDQIISFKNPYIYYAGLIIRATDDIICVEMEERKRLAGSSNFTLRKMINMWMDGFTAFSIKPLRISTFCGFMCSFLGFLYAIIIIIRKFIGGIEIAGYSSIMAVLLFIGGMIMLILGMIGEYLGRIYICIGNKPQFTIKERINIDE